MNMRAVVLSLLCAGVGFGQAAVQVNAPGATAQPAALSTGVMRLSMNNAVEIALSPEGSTKIGLAEQTIVRSETQAAQAKAALLPTIDGNFTDRNQTVNLRTFGFNFSVPGFTFPAVVGPFTVIDARANARWTVLDFSNIRRYKAGKAGVDTSRADMSVTKTQVTEQVARAYLATLRADAAIEAAQANLDLALANLDLASSQKDAGTGTGIEVTRGQVEVANNRGRLTGSQNDRSRAGLQLLRTMGLDLSIPVMLTSKLDYKASETLRPEGLVEQAEASRTELKAQKQRETVAKMNVSAVSAEKLPSLQAFGDVGAIGQPQIGLAQTHTVGFTVAIPLWDSGRRKARREETSSLLVTEQLKTKDLEQQVELEVRTALNNVYSAESVVLSAREARQLAENEVAQAQRRYQAGVGVPLEVTDAQARLDRARDSEVLALYGYNIARLDLALSTGDVDGFVQQ
jgi:outer membrane protein TolC